ncbi:MAG: hypothetical protein ACFE0O_09545 [Opitutales bacterium]
MVYHRPFLVLSACLVLVGPSGLSGETRVEDVIRLAREHVGPEGRLNAIEALRYQGRVEGTADGLKGTLVMTLKRPLKQCVEMRMESADIHEITATNGYEGYMTRTRISTGETQIRVLPPDTVRKMMINTWENLNFFAFPRSRYGQVHYQGKETVRGREAHVLKYVYPNGQYFRRFVDAETGDLLLTVTEGNLEIIETGDLWADGLRFPRTITTWKEGRVLHTVHFEKVQVNPEVKDSLFEFPES